MRVWLGLSLILAFAADIPAETTAEVIAHFKPMGRWLGDMNPNYRKKAWQVFCFTVPEEPLRAHLYRMESCRFVSQDLVHWGEKPIEHTDGKRAWWTEGIIEEGGKGYSFNSCLGGNSGINLAISDDMTHWTDHPANPIVPSSFFDVPHARSPYIFHNQRQDEYWMVLSVVTETEETRLHWVPQNFAGAFYYCRSKDLLNWSKPQVLYQPRNINIPECPELFELEEHYYLLGSPHLGDTVGKAMYRVADKPEGPWHRARTENIDGVNILAPNTGSDGQRRLFFGWIPTYEEGRDDGTYQWGGHLAFPREIYPDKDGTLFSRLPTEFLKLRGELLFPCNDKVSYSSLGASWSVEQDSMIKTGEDYGEMLLDGVYSHFELVATLTLFEDCPNAGFVFRAGDRDKFPGYEVAVDLAHQRLVLRRHLERRREIVRQDIMITSGEPVELRVFVDGSIVEVFLDDRYSLAGRAHVVPETERIGFYADYGGFEVSNLRVYQLREISAGGQKQAEVQLIPQPEKAMTHLGNSIVFPRMTAHTYTPYAPQLNPAAGLTLECWLRPSRGTSGARRDLIVKGDGPGQQLHYGLSLLRDNSIEFYYSTSSNETVRCSSQPNLVEESEWAHVAAVLDPEAHEVRLYKDGELVKKKTDVHQKLDMDDESALRLGFASGSPHFNPYFGLLDEVRVWSIARSS